ncbi:uncharacterized protein [Henckelia pumila]|uniref:uncharacterized protein n=1 Tax=Henckelia pumila TaxID=405737 RepID=UPI003C6DE2A2
MGWLLLTFLLFSTCLISEAPERKTRKLMMTHNNVISTTTAAYKNSKNQANKSHGPKSDLDSSSKLIGSKDGHLVVKSPTKTEKRRHSTDTDGQEKVDIVEMDYTLARRKPHIHN